MGGEVSDSSGRTREGEETGAGRRGDGFDTQKRAVADGGRLVGGRGGAIAGDAFLRENRRIASGFRVEPEIARRRRREDARTLTP